MLYEIWYLYVFRIDDQLKKSSQDLRMSLYHAGFQKIYLQFPTNTLIVVMIKPVLFHMQPYPLSGHSI